MNNDMEAKSIILIIGGLLSVVACMAIVIGGNRMRKCQDLGSANTAAILVIAIGVLFSACAVIFVPIGVWALVMLSKPEVKAEFRRVARRKKRLRD
jgi:multisubunit Na+/H+ antiporter MnhG subunit